MPLLLTPPKGAFGAIPAKLTPMLRVSTRRADHRGRVKRITDGHRREGAGDGVDDLVVARCRGEDAGAGAA
jgi:hypothetical protein